jgi:hypothetical protein
LALTDAFTRDAVQAMRNNCLQAITLDPTFAPAYALAARTYIQTYIQGWVADEPRDRAEVLDLVERGLRADRLYPLMLGTAGQCFAWFVMTLRKASPTSTSASGEPEPRARLSAAVVGAPIRKLRSGNLTARYAPAREIARLRRSFRH